MTSISIIQEWKRTGGTSGSMLDQEEGASAGAGGAGSGVGRRGRRPSIDTGHLYVQGETGGAVQILQVCIYFHIVRTVRIVFGLST